MPIISVAKDQGSCSTCVAFVMAAAMETALASGLQEPVTGLDLSEQALFFCSEEEGSTVVRSCGSPWTFANAIAAVQRLQNQRKYLPNEACLPYGPDATPGDLCSKKCSAVDPRFQEGKFYFVGLGSIADITRHIRWASQGATLLLVAPVASIRMGSVGAPHQQSWMHSTAWQPTPIMGTWEDPGPDRAVPCDTCVEVELLAPRSHARRRHGAVMTAMDEMSDLRDWLIRNPLGVYTDHKGTSKIGGHAVLLVGYDLRQEYWIAKNSW